MPIVLALFETLFDIVRLRKGPDAIPHSTVLLVIIVALWLLAGLVMMLLTAELDEKDFVVGTITGVAGLLCYTAVVVLSGKSARLMQAVMALLGCSALLSLMFVAGNVFLAPFLSERITNFVVTLILLWTVPVEGHIISRTIDRHWYLGVAVAMAVFVFQLVLYSIIDPAMNTPS
ncbi:MAG: hypothetical protein KJP16_14535 [Gammaproteobacteria bacterium]|nr:hypothetical protein [Gammaproteobacteria bacterium]NNL52018.1 hypothetical protein [Woeseiaceae bacterium]